jgi:alkylation response protein AidB-like acyl-CoA dehydrogenase
MTDLLYSDIEEALRSSVADLLADRSGPTRVLATIESDQPCDLALWETLGGQLGVAALLVPEKFGGVGGSAREAAVVAEELGRAVAPVPFLGSAVLATTALVACAAADPLAPLAAGDLVAALAVPLATMLGDPFPNTVHVTSGHVTGHVRSVADAAMAGLLVVPAIGPDGPSLYSVPADEVTVTPVIALDRTRGIADVTLDSAGTLLAGPDLAPAVLDEALAFGAGVLASEQLGVAQWCLDTTVSYVKSRYQFGRAVGSFQALKHQLADVWLELVTARAAARYAADALASGLDSAVAVSVAQAHCSLVAVHAAEVAVQLHGGIGMTWEHPLHLFLKRAKSSEIALGTPGRHRARLAGLVDLPGPVA